MTTYRVEIKHASSFMLSHGRHNVVYAVYPHCNVPRIEGVNSVVLNFPGNSYLGWDLKTLVSRLKKTHTKKVMRRYRIMMQDIPGDRRDIGATIYNRSAAWYINPLSNQL